MSKIGNLKIDKNIKEKLGYIGLDLSDVPENITESHDFKFKVLKGHDEKQYKQYRFVNIEEIDILLSNSNSFSELKEKYENASPLYTYLDSNDEENLEKYYKFLNMVKKVEIEDIRKVEKEQALLSKSIPFRVRYNGNYLWSIFYSEVTKRYFMIVPIENTNYATFFYLLKKKIENKKGEKIFAPISYLDYSGKILKKSEIKDIENYLWLFTKDYPSIYEVYDKKGTASIQIIGETQVYGKIKTIYKMAFASNKEANKFYKLLKALFILQTELPNYYKFDTNIDVEGRLNICLNNVEIQYDNLLEFVLEQYMKSISLKEKVESEIEELNNKLANYKKESIQLENEYIAKEKQISTFLECKKSFFGKVKYYFKLGKTLKANSKKNQKLEEVEEVDEVQNNTFKKEKVILEDRNYTLDELVLSFKALEIMENNKKDIVMDINALKLKNKNLKKKIENATSYINEINKHKKSIFEFWKYSNKDQVAALEEGEQEELNVTKIEKTFSFEDDFEKFGEAVDKIQRLKFTDSELDSSFIATTNILDLMNRTYKKQAVAKEFADKLKELKNNKVLEEDDDDDFDIFGKLSSDKTKERVIKNKTHRETPRNQYNILNIRKEMKGLELKNTLVNIIKDIKKALKKNSLPEDLYVYKVTPYKLDPEELQIFSLNEEFELESYLQNDDGKSEFYLYKIKLNKGTNFIGFSNIIYYNNKNMTLPLGMDLSSKILVDLRSIELEEVDKKIIRKIKFLDNKNDFSKIALKTIETQEFSSKVKKKQKKEE